MKIITTVPEKMGRRYSLLFLLLLSFLNKLDAQTIPVYANTVSSRSDTDLFSNAVDGNLSTRASVRAGTGLIAGIGSYSGHIELKFATTVPANTTTYVKIQTEENLLPSLLGGTLGGLLSDVAGSLLIGNQEFTVQAKNGTTNVVLEGNSQSIGEFATSRMRIVANAGNEYFIAITPSLPYDRIRLTNNLGSLVGLNNVKRLYVYDAYYAGTPDTCGTAAYTSFDGDGLNLDLIGLGGAGATNPQNVMTASQTDFSRLSLGILAVNASVSQTVYFDGLSQPSDQFLIRLKVDPSLLALGVANNIQFVASNGPTTVRTASLSSLLNLDLLTLLQGNESALIAFSPNGAANRITVRYSSLLNVQLTQSLDLYSITRVPANPTITDPFTLNPVICAGATASLVAQTGTGTKLNWYATATGNAILATTNSGQAFVTPALSQNTSYYVASRRDGCSEDSPRIRVNINVIALPQAPDINIANSFTACNGTVTLSPTAANGLTAFRYYKDPAKTQEITTGYTGDAGVAYVKNAATGELSISGLSAANSPYTYYVSLTVSGGCENAANTLKPVSVNYSATLDLQTQASIQDCGSVNLRNAILNFDSSGDIQYLFFNSAGNPITAAAASDIRMNGTYRIQAVSLTGSCSSSIQQVAVTVTPQPVLTLTTNSLVTNIGNTVVLNAMATAPIIWYDAIGIALPSNTAGPFVQAGTFAFTAIASNGNCSASGVVTVTVLDAANCPALTERVYANTQSWNSVIIGGVANAASAVDGNPQTFSTVTTGIGLLGIGTTWQTLQWNQTIAAGTPVTVKLGSEYSGLTIAGAYSIIGTKRNTAGIPVDIGNLQPISASLLNLLPGQNSFEFTFVPSNSSGPKNYDGIRIVVGSLVSVAQSVKVYEAYYNAAAAQVACASGDVRDVFTAATDLGIGVATTTVGVDNPFNAVDNSLTSFATMFSGAGILAAADLTVEFNTPTLAGDSTEILLSRPSGLLNLNLISGFTIQLFLGNTPVGAPIANTSSLLNLSLLGGGAQGRLVILPQAQQYDRIRIRLGGVATVLDQLRVHNIRRFANTNVVGGDPTNTVRVCSNDTVSLVAQPEACTTFIWYDAATGGNVVSTGTSFTVPSTLAAGTYTYYIQPVRFGCAIFGRGTVTVIVGQTASANAISQVTINGGTITTFCSTVSVNMTALVNSAVTLTNPVFYWYVTNGSTTTLVPNQSGATLNLTGLTPGTYTYAVGLSSSEFCQTAPADRKQITFTILPFSQPSDIAVSDALICQSLNQATLTPSTTRSYPVFTWYFSNNTSQPIISGSTVNGVTYTISATGALTASGLTLANSPYHYFVGLASTETCLNQAGNFKPVNITVNDSGTPTTTDTTPDFCLSDNPTIASIAVNEANVVFFTAATGGTLLPATTILANGATYYAAFSPLTGCASAARLPITVTVNNTGTPTTLDNTQEFCVINNPTVANLQANQPDVSWYLAATGGTALLPTVALVNGSTYFGSLTNTTTGCQSAVRLAVTATLNNPDAPTTNSSSQSFCLVNNPTVANLQANEANVSWYASATGGNVLALATPLTNGIYYGSLTDIATGCPSATRLAVTVEITNPATPTAIETTQEFCRTIAATIANIQVNESDIVWYTAANGGVSLPSTTVLTNDTIYFAALVDEITGCQSATRLAITINITDPGTPTTSDTTQEFCLADNPTVANIDVNEPNVIFYNAASGGTALSSADVLIDGATYYASFTDAVSGCYSAVRLAIAVNISNPGTPTTTNASQNFCLIDNPTVAGLQINETNVAVYNVSTGGTAFDPTTALTNGTYYVSFTGGACESAVRLAIAVVVSDPGTPTSTNASQTFCTANNPTVASIQINEPNVTFYDAAIGGNIVTPTTAMTNTTYYASLTDISGCQSATRLAIAVMVFDPGTPTTSDNSQDFCQSENPTVANLQVNESNVVFYDLPLGGTAYESSTALISGNTYYASLTANGCESAVRLAISVNINTTGTPTTTDASQDFCQIDNPTVANLQINETNVAVYNVATGGTAFDPTTALADGTYYVSFTGGACESTTRLEIAVVVSDPGTPTFTSASQTFCRVNNPTIANIQINESNVTFYDAATGGNIVTPTTALTNTTYYASLTDISGCQSATRLAIAVTVSDPGTPTTSDNSQDFCQFENPTIANIQVNESNVVFYDLPLGGTAYESSTALISGNTYYASLTANGCESAVRLAISVNINTTGTPTTTDTSQDFCLINNPTVANLQINETNVAVYNVATGGTALDPTTALANGTYYVSFTGGACESAVRLAIAVAINNAAAPTSTSLTQDFCQSANATVANLQVNQSNISWYTTATGGTALPTTALLAPSTYYAAYIDPATGCQSTNRLAIAVTFSGSVAAVITGGTPQSCAFDSVTYSTNSGMSNYNWTVSANGTITAGGQNTDNFVTVSWTATGTASVSVSYTNLCNETSNATFPLLVRSCSDITIYKTVDNPQPAIGENVVFTITVNNVGNGLLQNVNVSENLPSGYAFVSATVSAGTYSNTSGSWTIPSLAANQVATLTVTVTVLETGDYLNTASLISSDPEDSDPSNNSATAGVVPLCLIVYNEFSPNNDGANELFRIDCIENYPNNKLEVYNRYGALVFSKGHYTNDWDGTANVSGTLRKDEKLPTGTYYYILNTGADDKVLTGWLSIIR